MADKTKPKAAPKPKEPELKITLIGQSRSGKTNLMSTLFFNLNARTDLTIQTNRVGRASPSGIIDPDLISIAKQDSPDAADFDALRRHYSSILNGRDLELEGSDAVRRYPMEFNYKQLQPVSQPGTISKLFGRAPRGPIPKSVQFVIIDGRGGDVAPDVYIDAGSDQNAQTVALRDNYRDGLNDSIGMVICMPITKEEFNTEVASRLLSEITGVIQRKKNARGSPPLKYVSLCFTKYEMLFAADGLLAKDSAIAKDDFLESIRDENVLKIFTPILNESIDGQSFQTRIFPVSTYGFVEGEGASNYYDYPYARGLLTRAVDPDSDWHDDNLVDFQDHFPVRVTPGEAATMWHPFNIAPPILYALTGQETGPLIFHPRDILDDGRGR